MCYSTQPRRQEWILIIRNWFMLASNCKCMDAVESPKPSWLNCRTGCLVRVNWHRKTIVFGKEFLKSANWRMAFSWQIPVWKFEKVILNQFSISSLEEYMLNSVTFTRKKDKVKKKTVKKYCTMSPIMAIPETTLGNRFSGGKCGSSKPVTGFRSTAGANAAKVGRGLSWKENRKSRMLYTLIRCALISAGALLSLSATLSGVGGVTQVTKVLMYRFSQGKKRSSRGIF